MPADPLDLAKPMQIRAEMARHGLVFNQLLPYDDPERGHTDPMDDPEVRVEVRLFMGRIWQAALRAEATLSDRTGDTDAR
jgi:hypothetical protein